MDSALSVFPELPSERAAAPRCVAQLAFPEILVVWALRRYAGCRLPREMRKGVIAPEFSRIFGLARLEQALTAFASLTDSLASSARLPQAFSVLEDDRINATEEALLATLAALQHDATARAGALTEWCLLAPGRVPFLAACESLARALREAGQVMPYRAPPGRFMMPGARKASAGSREFELRPPRSSAGHTVH